MEREYLRYLKFLQHHQDDKVNRLYPKIRIFCVNLKNNSEKALTSLKEFFKLLFEIIDENELTLGDLELIEYFIGLDEKTEFSNELYEKELQLIEIISNICTGFIEKTKYIDYFEALKDYPDIYSKVSKCIQTFKTDPVTSVGELRTAIVNFSEMVCKSRGIKAPEGKGSNLSAVEVLYKYDYITENELKCLYKLIRNRNQLTYHDANTQRQIVKKISKDQPNVEEDKEIMEIKTYVNNLRYCLSLFYRVVNKYFGLEKENYDFPEQYFPIGDSEVIYFEQNQQKQFGQHENLLYLKRPGAYGFDHEGIVREYVDLEIDNTLGHNQVGIYVTQNLVREEDKKYFLNEYVINTADTSYYKYIGYRRVEGYAPLEYATNLGEKQATQVMLQIAYALRALRSIEPVIYHRNLSHQTILFNDDNPDDIKIKIGYFELIKINRETPTVRENIAKNIFLPHEVFQNAEVRDKNYDWSLFDIYSMGILYIYLILHKEIEISESNSYVNKIKMLLEDECVDDDILETIIGMINVPLERYNLDKCIERLESIYAKY